MTTLHIVKPDLSNKKYLQDVLYRANRLYIVRKSMMKHKIISYLVLRVLLK